MKVVMVSGELLKIESLLGAYCFWVGCCCECNRVTLVNHETPRLLGQAFKCSWCRHRDETSDRR